MMNRDDFMSLSAADYIRAMFANTRDGKLTIDRETLCLDWDEATMENLVTQFEILLENLTRLGREHAYWQVSTFDMPEDLKTLWDRLVTPFVTSEFYNEEIFSLEMKLDLEESLRPEEENLLERYDNWYAQACLQQMPYNRCSPTAFLTCQRRYERLVSLHAPKLILDNEARNLAEKMVQYHCLA